MAATHGEFLLGAVHFELLRLFPKHGTPGQMLVIIIAIKCGPSSSESHTAMKGRAKCTSHSASGVLVHWPLHLA
jgi:hypothetical protein